MRIVVACRDSAIFDLAGGWISLLPEEKKCGVLNFFHELIVRAGITVAGRRRRLRGSSTAAASPCECKTAKQSSASGFGSAGEEFAPSKIEDHFRPESAYGVSRLRRRCGHRIFFAKSGALHAAAGFLIFHELLPNEAGTVIFRHEHGDAEVDAENVRVVPIG